jgi:hypothetical protein
VGEYDVAGLHQETPLAHCSPGAFRHPGRAVA